MELSHVLVVGVESEDSTAFNPVLNVSAVTVSSLVVHLQSWRLDTSLCVSNLSHWNHSALDVTEVEWTHSRIVQDLPIVLMEGVTTTSERLKAKLYSHVSVVVKRTELRSQAASDLVLPTPVAKTSSMFNEVCLFEVHSVLIDSTLLYRAKMMSSSSANVGTGTTASVTKAATIPLSSIAAK